MFWSTARQAQRVEFHDPYQLPGPCAVLARRYAPFGRAWQVASVMDGFLGTRASLMLDVVALAMVVVLPVLGWSIYLVKFRQRYALHKTIQIALGAVLLITVVLFEADMRINGWRHRAADSPYGGGSDSIDWVSTSLYVHLFFAISAALLWVLVIVRALRNFPSPPQPGAHSAWHRRYATLAAIDMVCTAVTGWVFYWLAFVA